MIPEEGEEPLILDNNVVFYAVFTEQHYKCSFDTEPNDSERFHVSESSLNLNFGATITVNEDKSLTFDYKPVLSAIVGTDNESTTVTASTTDPDYYFEK